MVDSIIFMTAGLLLDMCGTFMIVYPLTQKIPDLSLVLRLTNSIEEYVSGLRLNEYKIKKGEYPDYYISSYLLDNYKFTDDIQNEIEKEIKYNFGSIKWGLLFLLCGFFFILIASWIDHLN